MAAFFRKPESRYVLWGPRGRCAQSGTSKRLCGMSTCHRGQLVLERREFWALDSCGHKLKPLHCFLEGWVDAVTLFATSLHGRLSMQWIRMRRCLAISFLITISVC